MTFDKYVELSTIKGNNKKYLQNLFKRYIDFCQENLKITDFKVIDGCPLDLNLDIYNPDNALKFMNERCHFDRSSVKKIRDIFLTAMRKCTRNPSLDYSVPLGQTENPNLKHYIKYDELIKFLKYLEEKKDFELFILFEILYKFGVRISALAKLKVNDLSKNQVLVFKEKNKKIIKRKLKDKLYNKLIKLIKINSLENSDYMFYNNLSPNDIDLRAKLFSNKVAKILKESQCFQKEKNETVSAHMFRATHAVNIFKKYGLELASRELNHSHSSTTDRHYIKAEDRNLFFNEEEDFFNNKFDDIIFGKEINNIPKNKKVYEKGNKSKKPNKKIKDLNSNELNLDLDDPELDNGDDSIYDSAFDLSYNLENIENKNYDKNFFLNKKRKNTTLKSNNDNITNDKIISDYEEFIKKNKIKISDFKSIIIDKIENTNLIKKLERFIKTLKNLNLFYKENSDKLNENINLITKAYSFKDISFFSSNFLLNIQEQIKLINNFQANVFEPKIRNNNINIISNQFLEKNTFLIDIVGTYCYKKTTEYDCINFKGFKDIFLFHCHDSKYDRYLKNSSNVNLGSLIAQSSSKSKGNCKIIKYLDTNLELKAGIVTSKDIKKGEILLLEN